jgi:hypothetical protein
VALIKGNLDLLELTTSIAAELSNEQSSYEYKKVN